MHVRTELASVLAAVPRYRSGTWTPRLKPAVRAACGGARERRLPRRAGGLAESCRLRFVGSCEVKVTVDIAERSSSCIYTRSVRPSAHGRLKRGEERNPQTSQNLRVPSCRRHPQSLAPLLAPDDPASPATTTACSRPTTTRKWGDESTGFTHHARLRFRACGSLRPRRAVPATASASQARPRSHSRRSCAPRAASSTQLSSGWACSVTRAACSSTKTLRGLTLSRPGVAPVTSGARNRPRRARPRRTRRPTRRASPRHATMRTAVGRASTGAPARSYCSSYCSSLRTPLASRSTTTRWSRPGPNPTPRSLA